MVTLSAFRDGLTALRSNPVLIVAGLLLGIGSQLQYASDLIESPVLSTVASLTWLLVFPFILGGFIATARAAIQGSDTSLRQFVAAGRSYYVRMLFGMIVFLLVVVTAAIGLGIAGFVVGVGSLALGAVNQTAAFVAGVGSMLVWLLLLLAVVLFIQFFDTAIVIEDAGVIDAFHRSIHLVKSNLKSVIGFSVIWVVLLNAFLIPEYLLRLLLTDDTAPDVLQVELGVPTGVLLPIGILLSAIGFAFFYTVYTAYYLRLIAAPRSDTEPT